jgi:hypothetical protein
VVRPVASGGGKTDITKVGLNSIPEGVVKNNLKGISPQMDKKGWVDSQGRKGKVCSVLRCPVGVVDTNAEAASHHALTYCSKCIVAAPASSAARPRRQHMSSNSVALTQTGICGCPYAQLRVVPMLSCLSHHVPRCCLQGYGVYRFANKYGANVDGYSPIYTPDLWSETGDTYKLGTKGLIAW